MVEFNRKDIDEMDRVFRLNLINSVSGYKSANLIGTQGPEVPNLAIFSSVIHLGSNPPLLGMIMRPTTVPRQTLEYIQQTGVYTINHVPKSKYLNAHYTSAKFEADQSEFEYCDLTPEYHDGFNAPFVKESPIKMGMKFRESLEIKLNGTFLIIGEIDSLFIDNEKEILNKNGQLDLNKADTVCISGLNRYHEATELENLPYARVDELPDFKS